MNNTEAPTYFTGKHAISMELRDYFAAKSLAWFLTKLDDEGLIDDANLHRQFAADHAYKMADAMLKAREA